MKSESVRYELRPGEIGEGLLKALYHYTQTVRSAHLDPRFMKEVKDELMTRVLQCAVSKDAAQHFDFPFEKKWDEASKLGEQEAISTMLA
jgi:hypothetical protein